MDTLDRELYSLVNGGSSVPAAPAHESTRPIDWNEEQRTDLPQRSPERIEHLLKYETPKQTADRITNDLQRYQHARTGTTGTNPQTRQISATEKVPTVHRWGN
ncbi:MAG: hypothetical protein WBX16_01960 [Candidatus Acidiferrales bacterium]